MNYLKLFYLVYLSSIFFCVYVCMYVCALFTYIHIYIYIYIYLCIYVCMYICYVNVIYLPVQMNTAGGNETNIIRFDTERVA